MKLDYINNINNSGENIVRLYDFNMLEAIKFKQIIEQEIIANKKKINLSELDFIEARNCNLILQISTENYGIFTSNRKNFYCELTIDAYLQMILLIEPFCKKESKAYQWLYDIDNNIDFLFSPAGSW